METRIKLLPYNDHPKEIIVRGNRVLLMEYDRVVSKKEFPPLTDINTIIKWAIKTIKHE
jgi:hypothetical protein